MTTPVLGYGPNWRIDGPQPQAPEYTLVGSARLVDDVDEKGLERWLNGVSLIPFPPLSTDEGQHGGVWDACGRGGSDVADKADGGQLDSTLFGAMVVYLAETCTAHAITGRGMDEAAVQKRFVNRALASLAAVESSIVEAEFLTGAVLSLNPHLSDGNGTFPWDDTPTSVLNGFALLEGEIAKSGKAGMIHCSPKLSVAAAYNNLIERDARSGVLRTINGTIVVPGSGYVDGATPDPSAGHPGAWADPTATQEWAYATGMIDVRRSPDVAVLPGLLSEAHDRATNTVTYRAERFYVVDWDGEVQAAVLVDRCDVECGSAPS